jgi:biopolymer transport protein ExbB
MKTTDSSYSNRCGKVLVLAGLLGGWALPALALAQDEPGEGEPAAAADVFEDGVRGPGASRRAPAKRRGIPTRASELFQAGGPMMWPIAACSVVVVAFAFERQVMLRRRRVIPRDFVKRFLEHLEGGQLERTGAMALCEQNGSPIAQVFAHGVRKWGKPSVEVEQAIIDGGERQVNQLRKHLRVLNTIATVSPLMGLLGTVWGMIVCFNDIATKPAAMGKTDDLAVGIGMALVATAGGLCVAIPALILYMYLAGRVDAVVMEMDFLAQKVVHLISAEGLASQSGELPRIAGRPKTMGTAALKNS